MENQTLIQSALENLRKHSGIKAQWKDTNFPVDGDLELCIDGRTLDFKVEVKQEVRSHQLDHIRHQSYYPTPLMVIAKKLYPKVKDKLREMNIAYLEENGNIFLKKESLFIWIETQKPVDSNKQKGNRAFTKTGLKVVFAFLNDKELVNKTQREIADKAGVALGNIPKVISGLESTGFLLKLKNKQYSWENREELLSRWITEYESKLKPGSFRNRYSLRKPWQEITLNTQETVWGGEPAADLLTNYLRPGAYTIYTKESNQKLIRNYGLKPDKEGNVWVYDKFFKTGEAEKTAPPLLVYADLMLSDDKRCRETANMIYNEYIGPKL